MTPERRTFYMLDYDQVNGLIEDHFGKEFDYHADQEAGNHADTFNFDGYLDQYGDGKVLEFIQTGKYGWLFYDLMNRMVRDGVIPSGDYVIDGWW